MDRREPQRRGWITAALLAVLVFLGCAVSNAVTAYAAAPSNDNRADAELLAGSLTGRSLLDATTEPGESLSCDADTYTQTVWFRYVAPAPGSVTLRVPTAARALSIYRADGTRVRCAGGTGALTVEVAQGEALLIQIGRLPSAMAYNYSLEVAFTNAPANDHDAFAEALGAVDQTPVFSHLGATTQPQEALVCGDSGYDHTVWYRYVAPAAGSVSVILHTSSRAISVYRSGRSRRCSTRSITSAGVRAGEALMIQVGRLPTATGYTTKLSVTLTPAPPNDAAATPFDLQGLSGTVAGTLLQATTEPGERLTCNGETVSSTLWYRLVAPARGSVVFRLTVANRALAVYRLNRTPVCTFSRVSLTAIRAGDALLVQLGRRPAATGYNNSLRYVFTPDPDQDRDGYGSRASGGADCDDGNARINPDRTDRPGNGIDENCDGSDAIGQTDVKMTLFDSKLTTRNGHELPPSRQLVVGVDRIVLRDLPAGSKLRLSCSGRGCRRHVRSRSFARGKRKLVVRRPLRRLKGARDAFKRVEFEARIIHPTLVGQVARWVVVKNQAAYKIKRRNLCAAARGPVGPCP